MQTLRDLGNGLWCAEAPGRAYGVELGERMVVVRLEGGALWVHGPIELNRELRTAVDRLGVVRHLCVPNRRVLRPLDGWVAAYPQAERWGPTGAGEQHPGVAPIAALGPGADPPWSAEIDHQLVEGMPALDEAAFLHRPSRSLLLTDLAITIPRRAPLLARAILRLSLGGLACGPTRDTRWLVRHRGSARRSLERVAAWGFDRIVVRRGDIVEVDAAGALRRAYRWLTAPPTFWQ